MQTWSSITSSRLFDLDARRATLDEIDDQLDEMRQTYRELATLHLKMKGIRSNLLRLKTQLNLFTCISAMPPEILEKIFSHCMCKHEGTRSVTAPFECLVCNDAKSHDPSAAQPTSPVRVRQTLSDVCSTWKSFVESYPKLWTVIDWDQKYEDVLAMLSRSAGMVLFIQTNLEHHTDSPFGKIPKHTVNSMRRILKRLHRIKELAVSNWLGNLEQPLTKYKAYHAPVLRRLAVTSGPDSYITHHSSPQAQFPFILTSPCPSLKILILGGFAFSSVKPGMLPVLQELYLREDRGSPTSLHSVISLLEGLPLLRKLSLSQIFPDDFKPETLQLGKSAVVLPYLHSLNLAGFSVHLLKQLRLPAAFVAVDITIESPARIPHIPEFECETLVSLSSQTLSNFVPHKIRIGTSTSPLLRSFCEAVQYSSPPAAARTISCSYDMLHDHTDSPQGVQLCRALPLLQVREYEVCVADGMRAWTRLDPTSVFDPMFVLPSLGMSRKEDWSDVAQLMSNLEYLRCSEENARVRHRYCRASQQPTQILTDPDEQEEAQTREALHKAYITISEVRRIVPVASWLLGALVTQRVIPPNRGN